MRSLPFLLLLAVSVTGCKKKTAAKAGDEAYVNRVNEPVLASPAMVDGTWDVRTPFHLMAIGK